jgi:hypothetical protein
MHEEEVAVAIMGILCLFGFGWVAVRYCYLSFKAWFDNSLKRDMVARGYTAQEIVAVIAADRRCRVKGPLMDVPPAKPIRQPAYGS